MEVDTDEQRLTLDHILANWFEDREHVSKKYHKADQLNIIEHNIEATQRLQFFICLCQRS